MITEFDCFLQYIIGPINSLILSLVFFFIVALYMSLSVPACFPPGTRSQNYAARTPSMPCEKRSGGMKLAGGTRI